MPRFGPVAKRDPLCPKPGHHLFALIIIQDHKVFVVLETEQVQGGDDSCGIFDPRMASSFTKRMSTSEFGCSDAMALLVETRATR